MGLEAGDPRWLTEYSTQTGGVTLTLSLAYLAVLTHQRNRRSQGDILRTQANVLNIISHDPSSKQSAPLPTPSRLELAAQERAHFVQTAKDRWNAEIEGAVQWAQTQDWAAVRESAEDSVASLFGLTAAGAQDGLKSAAEQAKGKLGEAKGVVAGGVASGVEKGREIVGKAKTAVGIAEEKLEAKVQALPGTSAVDKALRQRYEKSNASKRTVQEVLEERYKPVEQRDNTKLRGL